MCMQNIFEFTWFEGMVVYDTRIGFHVLKILFRDTKLPLCFQLQNHYSSRMV